MQKHKKIVLLASVLLTVLAACGGRAKEAALSETPVSETPVSETGEADEGSGTEEVLTAGTIARYPESGTAYMEAEQKKRSLTELLTPFETGDLDLRCADLREADLSGQGEQLLNASFDDRTKWPESLPEEFDREKLLELGKDPGLGVRVLHEQGITGKGVGIAIIDQALLVEHEEYADRLRLYQEYHTASQDPASMHGAAVASIALGKTVGVAPEALLYYIADDLGTGLEESFVRDMSYYAEDVERLIALNEKLPDGEKIRIISMSAGYVRDTKGAEKMDAAVAHARAEGIAVIMMNSNDPLMDSFTGMGRTPYGDPNDTTNCRPGLFWEEYLYNGEYSGADSVLVPMDRRTTAAQTGKTEYAYYPNGGSSWKAPYVAGLYALACQVKPDVTFEEFTAAAVQTAHPVSIEHEGVVYPYGKVADPAAMLELLKNEKGD